MIFNFFWLLFLIISIKIKMTWYKARPGELVNSQVLRNIDVNSQLVRVVVQQTFHNKRNSVASSFVFALDPLTKPNLAFIKASQNEEDGNNTLNVTEMQNPQDPSFSGKDLFQIQFTKPLPPGSKTDVRIEMVFTHALVPYPPSINRTDKQLVIYRGNHLFYSPYFTRTQTTTVVLPSSSVESFPMHKPVAHKENLIYYGPYSDAEPFSVGNMTIHFENNLPFLRITKMIRHIKFSDWGDIAVENIIDISHSGAKLKNPPTCEEFWRDESKIVSVKSIKMEIPASARNVYHGDIFCDISAGHMRMLNDSIQVVLHPRLPMIRGGRAQYILGYSIPILENLYNKEDRYRLKLRFVDRVLDHTVIDECTVRIVLPQFSKNIELKIPFEVERLPDEYQYSYLDWFGRPIVVLKKTNLVDEHSQDFEILFKYPKILLYQKPLMFVGLLLLLIVVVLGVRHDFSAREMQFAWSVLWVLIYVFFSFPIAILGLFWWATMYIEYYYFYMWWYYLTFPFQCIYNMNYSLKVDTGGAWWNSVQRYRLKFRERNSFRKWRALKYSRALLTTNYNYVGNWMQLCYRCVRNFVGYCRALSRIVTRRER